MKRFEFSLDRLLSLKKQQERLAELEQQRAWQAVEQARQRIRDVEGQILQLSESLGESVRRPIAPDCWVASCDLSNRLGQVLVDARNQLQSAQLEFAEKSDARAKIATEVEALNTLRNQQWELYRREQAQADQARLDEIGLNRWMANANSSNRDEARR